MSRSRTAASLACVVLIAVGLGGNCGGEPPQATWTFEPSMIFPADGSLFRPEDGVALPDGRLIVADQAAGLRLVDADGGSAPFGNMVEAGYRHAPPAHGGGSNGVAFEPGGTHLLVADIHQGGIFRVDVSTGDAEKIYQHRYGVNTAVRDSTGTIWFTQSAHNTPEEGEGRMWAAVDSMAAEGALYRLAMQDGRPVGEAELVVDGLQFGNGVVIDETAGHLYLAETMAARVLRYGMDLETGRLSDRTVVLEGYFPDNLELDGDGNLWVAAPISNALVVVETSSGDHRTVFQVQTASQQKIAAELRRRGDHGEPLLELITPDVWAPLPGLVTGVIVSPDGGPIYATGLGNALVRLPR